MMFSKSKGKRVVTNDTSSNSSDRRHQSSRSGHAGFSSGSESSKHSGNQTHSEAIEEATKWLNETNRFINNSGKHEKAITEADEWLNSTLKKLNCSPPQSSDHLSPYNVATVVNSSQSVSNNMCDRSSCTANIYNNNNNVDNSYVITSLHSPSPVSIAAMSTSSAHVVSSKSTDYYTDLYQLSPVYYSHYAETNSQKSAAAATVATAKKGVDVRLDASSSLLPSSSSYPAYSSFQCIRPSASFSPSYSTTTNNLSKPPTPRATCASFVTSPRVVTSSSHKSAASDSFSFTPNNMVTIRYPECKDGVLESPVYENITFMSSLESPANAQIGSLISPSTGINFYCSHICFDSLHASFTV